MKSYEEMAEQVLKRSEKEIEKRNMRRRKTTRIVSSLSCFCIIAVICFSVYNNKILALWCVQLQNFSSTVEFVPLNSGFLYSSPGRNRC